MRRLCRAGYILAFLAMCAGVLGFLQTFTRAESPFTYPAWETGAVVSAAGEETPFDPAGALPPLEEGALYRFTARLPEGRENGEFLIFETAGLEAAAFLDGAELWYSASDPPEGTVNLSQVQLPLPAGGGERLTLDLRPLSEEALMPPLLRLTDDPTDQAGAIAYANLYSFSAGATALALVLLWGLFLLGLSRGKRNWALLLPILAAGLLLACRLATGYGSYFLPAAGELLNGLWMEVLAALALALYLALRRDRAFWRGLGLCAAWSAGGLLAAGLLSRLWGGHLARYLSELAVLLAQGKFQQPLYCLTTWLVLVCALLSAWELTRFLARTQGEAAALALRNQLMMDNYRALERKLREGAKQRHEQNHQLAALDAMLQSGDLDGLRQGLAAWRQAVSAVSPALYTRNIPFNAILQDAAGRAREAGIAFQASAVVPEQLPIPDTDLCALLLNLFDNALAGASRAPAGREKSVVFKAGSHNGFLTLFCENTFDGRVETDGQGNMRTTKEDSASHGLGLAQMRAVAEKYGSILDVSWTEERFTVQTALRMPGVS